MTPARGTDAGMVVPEFTLAVGVLLLPMALLVLSLPGWFEAHAMGRAAAAEAARIVAVDGSEPHTLAAARAAAARIDAHAPGHLAGPPTLATERTEGAVAVVVARVDVVLPALDVPFVGSFGAVTVQVAHREAVDPYRARP